MVIERKDKRRREQTEAIHDLAWNVSELWQNHCHKRRRSISAPHTCAVSQRHVDLYFFTLIRYNKG